MINNIKEIRMERKISQEKLARACDISLRQMQNIENNRNVPSIELALKIKKALNCENVEELFKLEQ